MLVHSYLKDDPTLRLVLPALVGDPECRHDVFRLSVSARLPRAVVIKYGRNVTSCSLAQRVSRPALVDSAGCDALFGRNEQLPASSCVAAGLCLNTRFVGLWVGEPGVRNSCLSRLTWFGTPIGELAGEVADGRPVSAQ